MATSYPGAIDSLPNPTSATLENAAGFEHDVGHSNLGDAIEAIETELGTDPSGSAATVKARLTAMDAVDALRVVGSNATTAPSSPVVGQVWVDHSTPATPVIKVWSGSAWVNPSSAGSGGAALVWATVTGGTVTEYTKGDGSVMEVHTFTATGSNLTVVAAGYADCLLVSGGSGGSGSWYGSGGDVRTGLYALPAGTHAVVIGAGGINATTQGERSSIGGTLLRTSGQLMAGAAQVSSGVGADGAAGGWATGLTSAISGTAVEYAKANMGPAARVNRGDGGGSEVGSSGIVVVAVQKTPPTASGVVASGGTESTFTGDGTNGVLGQAYKVHTFTASGSLVVSVGGAVDVLVVGGGGQGGNRGTRGGGGGGAGGMVEGTALLSAGTVPVTVGAGGAGGGSGFQGKPGLTSRLGSLFAFGGGGGAYQYEPGQGGSGGGGCTADEPAGTGIPGQGNNGGAGAAGAGAGGGSGGGAGAAGVVGGATNGSAGGAGQVSSIKGTVATYAGGGGGGSTGGSGGAGGSGGGGAGSGSGVGTAGTANTGGGGGGGSSSNVGGAGATGIVIVRYKV